MAIVLKNVSFTYMAGTSFSRVAINEINLTINENEFVAVIGHTGSGKSTLITHMNGLIQPDKGSVEVDGLDLREKKNRKIGRSLVGMVFQYPEHQLFEETVAKDIAFGPLNMQLSNSEIDERVQSAMRLVGLDYDEFAGKSPFDLSGGEKRRAALAGIIAMRPKYLVLDEPMAGLDPSGRRSVMDTIVKLRSELGCAIVMISHSMDDISKIAERIVVMDNGSIVMDGLPGEIFERVDELQKMGLGIPQALTIARALRERGIDVPEGIYETSELIAFLKRRCAQC